MFTYSVSCGTILFKIRTGEGEEAKDNDRGVSRPESTENPKAHSAGCVDFAA